MVYCSSMAHATLEEFTYVVKVAGAVGSFIVFCIAVSTYYRTERWKRAEFLANEMKGGCKSGCAKSDAPD
jgi:hypothetical protein